MSQNGGLFLTMISIKVILVNMCTYCLVYTCMVSVFMLKNISISITEIFESIHNQINQNQNQNNLF